MPVLNVLRRTAAVLAAGMAAIGTVHALPAAAADGICSDVPNCQVVARVDVTGDGVRDAVAVGSRGRSGSADRVVFVRVRTSTGRVVGVRRSAAYFYGPLWQGAAALDGKRGQELVVGRTMGAHTTYFTAITWRKGKLVSLRAPGGGDGWVIDSAYSIIYGWQRADDDPAGLLRRRVALRETDGTWSGKVVTFQWTPDGWERHGTRTTRSSSWDPFLAWGGFRVRGLQRW